MAGDVAKWGLTETRACDTKYKGGGASHHFGGSAAFPARVSSDMGHRSDSIAMSRDMGGQ